MGGSIEGTGDRFRVLADVLYDGNQSALARAIDMQPGSFTKYVRGERRPGAPVLERLTRLGVNVNWLLTGDGSILLDEEASIEETFGPSSDCSRSRTGKDESAPRRASEYHPVPVMQVRVGTDGEVLFDEMGASEWISDAFIREQYGVAPSRLRGFRVSCNFMADTIRPGDRIRGAMLSSDWSPENTSSDEDIYLLLEPRGLLVTRLAVQEHAVVLSGDNPALDDRLLSWETWNENVRPIARVLEVIRRV